MTTPTLTTSGRCRGTTYLTLSSLWPPQDSAGLNPSHGPPQVSIAECNDSPLTTPGHHWAQPSHRPPQVITRHSPHTDHLRSSQGTARTQTTPGHHRAHPSHRPPHPRSSQGTVLTQMALVMQAGNISK